MIVDGFLSTEQSLRKADRRCGTCGWLMIDDFELGGLFWCGYVMGWRHPNRCRFCWKPREDESDG